MTAIPCCFIFLKIVLGMLHFTASLFACYTFSIERRLDWAAYGYIRICKETAASQRKSGEGNDLISVSS